MFAVDRVFDELGVRLPVILSGTITDQSGRTLSQPGHRAFYNSLPMRIPGDEPELRLGPDLLRQCCGRVVTCLWRPMSPVYPDAGLPNEFGLDLSPDDMGRQIGDGPNRVS